MRKVFCILMVTILAASIGYARERSCDEFKLAADAQQAKINNVAQWFKANKANIIDHTNPTTISNEVAAISTMAEAKGDGLTVRVPASGIASVKVAFAERA